MEKFFSSGSQFAIHAVMNKKKKFYAVARGRKPGIYDQWFGEGGAKANIDGFSNAVFKKFSTLEDAASWLKDITANYDLNASRDEAIPLNSEKHDQAPKIDAAEIEKSGTRKSSKENCSKNSCEVIIYTDGACIRNPGPGGFGTVLKFKGSRKEISGGYRKTTNNRMEIMACIEGLKTLKKPCQVIIYSDSKYVVNAIEKGWVQKWRSNGWMRTKTESAENVDLWEDLLKLCERHKVEFRWVKGHAGNPENERCDQLAKQNALKSDLPPDKAYEQGKTKAMTRSEFLERSS